MIFEKIENKFIQCNHSFRQKLFSLCPPGYELAGEYRVFWCWLVVSVAYSFKFLINYDRAYYDLFYRTKGGLKLNVHAKMQPFGVLIEDSMNLFAFGILFLACVFAMHYIYYRRESKSIYVMRRLKDRRLLWKSYIGTPVIYGMILLVAAIVLLGLYYLLYRLMTPAECLII